MNNPLAQKYNYYLNESHRLNEELKTEESYSELLENVLFELLGEEDFTNLFEVVMQGTVTRDASGNPLSKERSERRAKRIGQIVAIGRKAAENKDEQLTNRVASSVLAKGATAGDENPDDNARSANVRTALKTGGKIKIQHDHRGSDFRSFHDDQQKEISAKRRRKIKWEKDEEKNTF